MFSRIRSNVLGRSLARAVAHVSWRDSSVEAGHCYEVGDRTGNWTTGTVEVESSADLPLAESGQ